MKVFTTIAEMQREILTEKQKGKTIGFVPTMGFLHEGHIGLLKKARQENDILVLSIFVNPLQFGPSEDLDAYPRDFEKDRQIAIQEKTDYIFFPSVDEMYSTSPSVGVIAKERVNVLCGKSRPGHFDGVVTVLTKLFNIIQPTRVYFGLKDAQQVAVVDGLIKDFHFPVQLKAIETVRESDGLAKSSRNVNLTPEERRQAAELYRALELGRSLIKKGETDRLKLIQTIESHLKKTTESTVDYIELYTYPDLKPIEEIKGKVILALAVKFSKVRLIDNIIVDI
ncbi:pantoate--beta-alanine ligase [Mesobacillus harenae]|uniref:pantoate--beta-alanine ligase n=1 Tax=Mesobacillus harenae TaxID=2213203 RepID=UPI0015811EB7|nr:pantoate--beta-alanine ligase [Mesobacillus harenae]